MTLTNRTVGTVLCCTCSVLVCVQLLGFEGNSNFGRNPVVFELFLERSFHNCHPPRHVPTGWATKNGRTSKQSTNAMSHKKKAAVCCHCGQLLLMQPTVMIVVDAATLTATLACADVLQWSLPLGVSGLCKAEHKDSCCAEETHWHLLRPLLPNCAQWNQQRARMLLSVAVNLHLQTSPDDFCQRASCATCSRDPFALHHERLSADEARSWTMQRHWDDPTRVAEQELTFSTFRTTRSLVRLVFVASHLVCCLTMTSPCWRLFHDCSGQALSARF